MCRFVSYIGKEKLVIGKLLAEPNNSLIKQSLEAREGTHGVNADGFGVAWYNHEIDDEPGVFKSTHPAWNNSNLKHLARKIKSNCFLSHIRASTVGGVTLSNCHPFSYKQYAFVHNGTIEHFAKIRRSLMNELNDELFCEIRGKTDSECLFFLIMQYVHDGSGLESAVRKAFKWIADKQSQESDEHFSVLNIVISDGKELIATRFATKERESLALNYMIDNSNILIASEPLDDYPSTWTTLPVRHCLVVEPGSLKVEIKSF